MPQAKPLPATIRHEIAQAVLQRSKTLSYGGRKIELVIKKHGNKQLSLILWQGSVGGTILRVHKKLHKIFYQIVAAAKKLLATLISALADPLPVAPVALLPATVPISAAEPAPARSLKALTSYSEINHEVPARGVPAWSNTGKDTPRSRWEAADVAAHQALSPRQVYERNVRFNRAKVLAQVASGLQ